MSEPQKDLKSILQKLQYPDDAKVMAQLTDQIIQVKTRMAAIRRKVLVMSGKGGVGKSMVTVNLALALARAHHRVAILDVDLNGPCVPKMLGIGGATMTMSAAGAEPVDGPLGLKVASMDFFLPKESPVRWKGPIDLTPVWLGMMEMSVLREFLADVRWGEQDYLLADLPPGAAADKPPAIVGFLPELDGAVVVTTPSEVATDVVKKSIVYARDVGIPIIGLIENMSGFLCPECGVESELFHGNSEALCQRLGIRLLGRIPFDRAISEACDRGTPLLDPGHPMVKRFDEIAHGIHEAIEARTVATG